MFQEDYLHRLCELGEEDAESQADRIAEFVERDPNRIEEDFAKLPGVVTREYRENDSDDKSVAAAQINAQLRAQQQLR